MRLTDEQVVWNKKAAEYNALCIEIGKALTRVNILKKKSPAAAKIMRDASSQLMKRRIEVKEELSKMKGPDDEAQEKGSVQGAATSR